MAEYRFETWQMEHPPWSFEFHFERERVAHWEEGHQRPRMEKALQYVETALNQHELPSYDGPPLTSIVDLGCGDGGMLQQIKLHFPEIEAWGYDFQPSNVEGWVERKKK